MKILAGSVVVMLISFTFVIAGVQALAGSSSDEPDPFFSSAYTYIGQPVSAIEGYLFSCSSISGFYDSLTLHCTPKTTSGIYSEIRIVSSEGVASDIAFTMQTDTVQVGHLILFWGKPEIRRHGRSVYLYWRSQRILALLPRKPGLFSVSLPVWKVYFLDQTARV